MVIGGRTVHADKMMKKTLAMITAAVSLTAALAITSFAAGWFQDGTGWRWYNEDGSVIAGGWHWLDGNGDGIAESYCFNDAGYIYQNTVTPDNYTVNADGAWTVNGVVQTRQTGTSTLRPASSTASFQQDAALASANAGAAPEVTQQQAADIANWLADDLYIFWKNNRLFSNEFNRSDLNYDQVCDLMLDYAMYIKDPRMTFTGGPVMIGKNAFGDIILEVLGKSGKPALKRLDDMVMELGDQYVFNYKGEHDGDFSVSPNTLTYAVENGMLRIQAGVEPTRSSEENGWFVAYFVPSGKQGLYGYTFERIELKKYK